MAEAIAVAVGQWLELEGQLTPVLNENVALRLHRDPMLQSSQAACILQHCCSLASALLWWSCGSE